MIDEGYIKYQIDWTKAPPVTDEIDELIAVRNQLYEMELIGFYEEHQVGYGNISLKTPENGKFIVSGTQTGGLPVLDRSHFTTVLDYDLEQNRLSCLGPVKASSESLTHAAVYACSPEIQAIIHVHTYGLWEWMLKHFPFTKASIPYGTPEMAMEVMRLYRETNLPTLKSFAMAGHEEGIFTFGSSLTEAMEWLQKALKGYHAALNQA